MSNGRGFLGSVSLGGQLGGRVLTILLAFAFCLLITFLGAIAPINASEAEELVESVEKELQCLRNFTFIFGNNFTHCLMLFVPFIGPLYAILVFYSTGRFIAALAAVRQMSSPQLFGFLLRFPHTWMEYFAYSLAISQSIWLAISILRRRLRREVSASCVAVTVCALILLSAAVVEVLSALSPF